MGCLHASRLCFRQLYCIYSSRLLVCFATQSCDSSAQPADCTSLCAVVVFAYGNMDAEESHFLTSRETTPAVQSLELFYSYFTLQLSGDIIGFTT